MKKIILFIPLLLITLFLVNSFILKTPSNDRNWAQDQLILPFAEFNDDTITIKNIRNFTYQSQDGFTSSYYDKTIKLTDVESVDYIVEPLASVAVAHTFLSFGMKDGSRIAISVEIRKEVGEIFSPIKALFNAYEIMYVIVDERDVLTLRAVHRDNPVYVYPTIATPKMAQELFKNMLREATNLIHEPQFYNTITNTCATNIVKHLNTILPKKIGWDYRILLPKESDTLAYELGFILNRFSLTDLRKKYDLQTKIQKYEKEDNFSQLIRE